MGNPGLIGRGWVTGFDFDFTAQASQTLSPDGYYTIGGYDWRKSNSVSDAVAMAITSGTGLVVQPVSASEYNGSTRTLPILQLYLNQIPALGALEWASSLRLWVHVAAFNGTTNFDNAIMAIDSATLGTLAFQGARGWGSAGIPTMSFQQQINGSIITGSSFAGGNTLTLGGTNNVVVIDISRLDGFVATVKTGGFGLATGKTWPDPSNLQTICGSQGTAAAYNLYDVAAGPFNVPANQLAISLGAKRSNAGTAGLSVTYGHVRLDYKT